MTHRQPFGLMELNIQTCWLIVGQRIRRLLRRFLKFSYIAPSSLLFCYKGQLFQIPELHFVSVQFSETTVLYLSSCVTAQKSLPGRNLEWAQSSPQVVPLSEHSPAWPSVPINEKRTCSNIFVVFYLFTLGKKVLCWLLLCDRCGSFLVAF